MAKPRHEHGIEHEPHLRAGRFQADPSEAAADRKLPLSDSAAERAEQGVWQEPAISVQLTGGPDEDAHTYASWLSQKIEETTSAESLIVTLGIILTAGLWGILGAIWTGIQGAGLQGISLFAVVVFGPVTEEALKVAIAWWVVEKRPYLFLTSGQILFCAAFGGLAFAAIENLIYMYVYVPDHSEAFVIFRWTVCVALHVCCSLIAGCGLARMWEEATTHLTPPRTLVTSPWLVIAIVVHGAYNLGVSIAAMAGWMDFLR